MLVNFFFTKNLNEKKYFFFIVFYFCFLGGGGRGLKYVNILYEEFKFIR